MKTETILILLVGAYFLTRPAAAPVEDSGSGFELPGWVPQPPSADDLLGFFGGGSNGNGNGNGNGNSEGTA